VKSLCELFGVSKQAYYKHDAEKAAYKAAQVAFALEYVREVREKDPGIGGTKMWHMYRMKFSPMGDIMGRDRFEDMINDYGLKVRNRTRKPRTTDSTHGLPTYPNLVKDLIPTRPNQFWVSDITYVEIWLEDGSYFFSYVTLIMDAYTKEIIGWNVADSLATEHSMKALEMAMRRVNGMEGLDLIHHSDRGIQYASREYTSALKSRGIRISMTETGDPKDNAMAERINNTLKNELLKGYRPHSIHELRTTICRAVDFYNNERPHMSINMMTPAEAAMCTGEIVKCWTSYRERAIKRNLEALDIAENSLPLQENPGSPSELRSSVNPGQR